MFKKLYNYYDGGGLLGQQETLEQRLRRLAEEAKGHTVVVTQETKAQPVVRPTVRKYPAGQPLDTRSVKYGMGSQYMDDIFGGSGTTVVEVPTNTQTSTGGGTSNPTPDPVRDDGMGGNSIHLYPPVEPEYDEDGMGKIPVKPPVKPVQPAKKQDINKLTGQDYVDAVITESEDYPFGLFPTPADAAYAFGEMYNGASVIQNREYGAVIIRVMHNGKPMYTWKKTHVGGTRKVREAGKAYNDLLDNYPNEVKTIEDFLKNNFDLDLEFPKYTPDGSMIEMAIDAYKQYAKSYILSDLLNKEQQEEYIGTVHTHGKYSWEGTNLFSSQDQEALPGETFMVSPDGALRQLGLGSNPMSSEEVNFLLNNNDLSYGKVIRYGLPYDSNTEAYKPYYAFDDTYNLN